MILFSIVLHYTVTLQYSAFFHIYYTIAQKYERKINKTHSYLRPKDVVKDRGLEQMQNSDELDAIIKAIVDASPAQVAAYKSGKSNLFGFFVGQAMQKTKGNGNPVLINDLLKKYLS